MAIVPHYVTMLTAMTLLMTAMTLDDSDDSQEVISFLINSDRASICYNDDSNDSLDDSTDSLDDSNDSLDASNDSLDNSDDSQEVISFSINGDRA